jgi:hypothetical protein
MAEIQIQQNANKAKEEQSRLIEAQRPFLVKQLELYFETAAVVGKLVSIDVNDPNWESLERRYWALYWSELSMVEHRVVEAAMKNFGDTLVRYKVAPIVENKRTLQSAAYNLAHAIRTGIEAAWGTTATGIGPSTDR